MANARVASTELSRRQVERAEVAADLERLSATATPPIGETTGTTGTTAGPDH